MVTRTPARAPRPAAASASTVFAIALAIVAGLIFAWLFKIFLFNRPKTGRPVDTSVELTVAATNIYDKWEVKPIDIKKIRVSREAYDKIIADNPRKHLLEGNQPVRRVTMVPVLAEKPFFAEDMYPFEYPKSIIERIHKGMRPVIVTVPAKEAMVQLGDVVDVYCTLSNDALGSGGTAAAMIAKGSQVVARFGTTRPGAQPVNNTVPREYTLEVTPYRYALIELAKTYGAKFSLAVTSQVEYEEKADADGLRKMILPASYTTDVREQSAERVTGADLAALFGIEPPVPGTPPHVIEKYVGIHPAGNSAYPGYVPPSSRFGSTVEPAATPPTTPTPTPGSGVKPAGTSQLPTPGNGALPGATSLLPPPPPVVMPPPSTITLLPPPGARPAAGSPPPATVALLPPPGDGGTRPAATASYRPGMAVASAGRNYGSFGFRAPGSSAAADCVG